MASAKRDTLDHLRRICLALPDVEETLTWGKPHFRVAGKIFCGYGEDTGRPTLGFKSTPEKARTLLRDPRFRPAPFVGHKGWVTMDASVVRDWDEVRRLVTDSYVLIAPKRSLARLYGEPVPEAARPPRRRTLARDVTPKNLAPRNLAPKNLAPRNLAPKAIRIKDLEAAAEPRRRKPAKSGKRGGDR